MSELLNSSLKFAMREETLTFTLEGIAEKKFFTRYHSQNITKNPQSSSEYPYSLPFVRLHYWHLSVNFMSAFLGWKEFEKEAMPMMFHMALMPSFLHTGVQLPVLKNQCFLSSCFPSVMRQKIQMSTHPVKKNELQSHQVFSEKL